MVKAIPFKEVRPGDVVEDSEGMAHRVERIDEDPPVPPGFLILWLETQLAITGHPDEFIGLLRRPCTRQESDAAYRRVAELLEQTTKRTGPFGGVIDSTKFPELLLALQEYELSKKETAVLGVSSDRAEAEVDASCGYLGGGPVGC